MVELGQFWAVVADTWWYRVSMGWYWLVHGGTGSLEGGKGQKVFCVRLKRSEIGPFSGF